MKIGHKLTLGFVGLALLIAAIGYVALRTSQKTLEKAIGESSADLAEQILDTIDRTICRRVEEIQAYATDELAKEYTARSNAQFEKIPDPNGYIEQVDSDWTCEGNELTPVMVQLTTNKLAKELQSWQYFYQNKYDYPLLGEIFITNRFGANVAQTNKTTDYYQADEQWWQIARKEGLFISDVRYDESSGTFSTEIAVRIDDASGNFLGVIKAVPNIRETINIINEAKLAAEYKTMQLHLVNKEAKIIYSTKGYGFLEDVHDQLAPRFGYPDRPEHKYYVIGDKTGEKGILFAHAHSHKYKDFKGLGWTLITETNTAEIFAPIVHLRNTMLLAGLAVMGLALLASSITYRSVVVPIAELQDATIQIASGNLDTNLTKTATDEIGQLANSFQRMAQRLKKTISDLNDEVAGRKKTEEKLRDKQRFLDNIFDSIQDGIDVLDKDLNVVKVNAWKEKMHANTMPLVGKKCFEAFHQRHEVCPSCPSLRALNTGKQQTEIVSNICADNQTRWFEITAFPFKDADGNSVGVIEHIKDITERKRTEEALQEGEGRLRTILDNVQTGIFIIDPETHTIVDANPVAAFKEVNWSAQSAINMFARLRKTTAPSPTWDKPWTTPSAFC
jgi:PAS domain S-box-containing protein